MRVTLLGMERFMSLLRIRSNGHVLLYTGLITLLSVAVPLIALYIPMSQMPRLPARAFWMTLAIAGGIPLFIAPPIAFVAFSILRMLTLTIDRVDDYVRFDTLTGVLSRAYLLGKMRRPTFRRRVF